MGAVVRRGGIERNSRYPSNHCMRGNRLTGSRRNAQRHAIASDAESLHGRVVDLEINVEKGKRP
jgi:hypothetical protein